MVMFKKAKLKWGIQNGDLALVRRMLELGTNPSYEDEYGRSFLYFAIQRGSRDAAELLLERGAAVSAEIRSEGTLLHLAARKGSVEIAAMLLEKKPDLLSIKDRDGDTPLHAAAENGYAEVAAFLIEKGADPNLKNFSNRTPLYLAQKQNHAEVVELLKPLTQSPRQPLQIEAAEEPGPQDESEVWKKLPGERIARIASEEAIGYRITEIFNFSARERTTLYQNLDTRAETVETRTFDQIGDKAALEEALAELKKRGGAADIGSINGFDKKKLGL
jgi:uncharacterized protein